MSIKSLKEKNQYPIIFIGSGMSKRYIESSPDWLNLLEEYWIKLGNSTNFYSYLSSMRKEIEHSRESLSNEQIDFVVNAQAATEIQKKFDDLYNKDNSLVPELNPKSVYMNNLSPFKESVAKRFSELKFLDSMTEELSLFGKVLSKAKMIITTNYDKLIEELLTRQDKSPDIFIGNSGFFQETTGWGELYKIHGTCDNSSSIVITDKDYAEFNENSILLNAKLLTSLVDSPIIFLGYSLTDENVRSLLQAYANNLPTDVSQSADRITIVEYKSGEQDIFENVEHDPILEINYTRIQTDNYVSLFKQISEINQGVSPAYIRKYQQEFRQIIETKGQAGELDTFLTYANNIDELPADYKLKNTAVAIGDRGNLFVIPTFINYINDYFKETDNISLQISARFLAQQQPNANFPYSRLIKRIKQSSDLGLTAREKEKIQTRINQTYTLDEYLNHTKINKSDQKYLKENLKTIWDDKTISELNRIKIITKNIKTFKNQIDSFIIDTALPRFTENYVSVSTTKSGIITAYRRLFVVYDLLKNGDVKK